MKENRLYLKFPTLEDKENVMEFKEEFLASGQGMSGVGSLDKIEVYEEWLEKVQADVDEKTCKPGRVPASQYLTYRKEDNKLVGMVQLRHYLNEFLLHHGGHIGDCVRPSEQGKGYATEQIGLALEECKKLGIERVLITCKKTNVASARTIIKNNGKLENEIEENGETFQRYWVEINTEFNEGEK